MRSCWWIRATFCGYLDTTATGRNIIARRRWISISFPIVVFTRAFIIVRTRNEIFILVIPDGISKGDLIPVKNGEYIVFIYFLYYICSLGRSGGGGGVGRRGQTLVINIVVVSRPVELTDPSSISFFFWTSLLPFAGRGAGPRETALSITYSASPRIPLSSASKTCACVSSDFNPIYKPRPASWPPTPRTHLNMPRNCKY